MDSTALFRLSYGLYIIGAKDGARNVGCVVNTVTQATSKPVTLTVCINRDNYTNACIKRSGSFSVSILSEKAKELTLGIFGFSSSLSRDKFAEVPTRLTPSGLPYVSEGVTGYLQCKVLNFVDNFTHTIFIAEVQEAENLHDEPPMTYAYYHNVIKGKTPPKASSYADESEQTATPEVATKSDIAATTEATAKTVTAATKTYICSICGYAYPGSPDEFEQLPDSYTCPICGAPKSEFKLH